MSGAWCMDPRRPAKLTEPHGAWWLTVRVPLGRARHVYIAAASAPRFVAGRHTGGRVLVDRERFAVIVMPRRFCGGRHIRGWVMLRRFCAHVRVIEALSPVVPASRVMGGEERG